MEQFRDSGMALGLAISFSLFYVRSRVHIVSKARCTCEWFNYPKKNKTVNIPLASIFLFVLPLQNPQSLRQDL